MSLGNSAFTHSGPISLQLSLDCCFQKIEKPLVVKLCGRPSGSLNKKQS